MTIIQNITDIANGVRYTFSAKEKDSETGLSYFGSRYYSSDLSVWLSVDPMSDKYPSLSPYVYCADNPVRVVDPDGEEIDDNLDKWKYNITTKELQWVSDEGGRDHQTVVMTAGKGNDEKAYQKVDFDGPVTLMFNPTVFGEKMDGVINGALDIVNGGITAYYGAAISVGSEGAASPIGYPIFIAGATQMSFGAKKIAYSLNGDYDLYQQHDMMVDICKSVANSAVSTAAGFKNQPLKKISTAITGVVASFTWSEIQRRKATHPINKGVPKNTRIKKLL